MRIESSHNTRHSAGREQARTEAQRRPQRPIQQAIQRSPGQVASSSALDEIVETQRTHLAIELPEHPGIPSEGTVNITSAQRVTHSAPPNEGRPETEQTVTMGQDEGSEEKPAIQTQGSSEGAQNKENKSSAENGHFSDPLAPTHQVDQIV